MLAWEYGGSDHQWIKPPESALVYCVYTPVRDPSPHWKYDAAGDEVTADVYVKFPDHNPCGNLQGGRQIIDCVGDETNFEILVDTASINDGVEVGLSLSNASTTLRLILRDGSTVPVWHDRQIHRRSGGQEFYYRRSRDQEIVFSKKRGTPDLLVSCSNSPGLLASCSGLSALPSRTRALKIRARRCRRRMPEGGCVLCDRS